MNLLPTIMTFFDDNAMGLLGAVLGEHEVKVRDGVQSAVPEILSALASKTQTEDGRKMLWRELRDTNNAVSTSFPQQLHYQNSVALVRHGQQQLTGMLGTEADRITERVSHAADIGSTSARKVVGVVTPLIFSKMASEQSLQNLSEADWGKLFASQADGLHECTLVTRNRNDDNAEQQKLLPSFDQMSASGTALGGTALAAVAGVAGYTATRSKWSADEEASTVDSSDDDSSHESSSVESSSVESSSAETSSHDISNADTSSTIEDDRRSTEHTVAGFAAATSLGPDLGVADATSNAISSKVGGADRADEDDAVGSGVAPGHAGSKNDDESYERRRALRQQRPACAVNPEQWGFGEIANAKREAKFAAGFAQGFTGGKTDRLEQDSSAPLTGSGIHSSDVADAAASGYQTTGTVAGGAAVAGAALGSAALSAASGSSHESTNSSTATGSTNGSATGSTQSGDLNGVANQSDDGAPNASSAEARRWVPDTENLKRAREKAAIEKARAQREARMARESAKGQGWFNWLWWPVLILGGLLAAGVYFDDELKRYVNKPEVTASEDAGTSGDATVNGSAGLNVDATDDATADLNTEAASDATSDLNTEATSDPASDLPADATTDAASDDQSNRGPTSEAGSKDSPIDSDKKTQESSATDSTSSEKVDSDDGADPETKLSMETTEDATASAVALADEDVDFQVETVLTRLEVGLKKAADSASAKSFKTTLTKNMAELEALFKTSAQWSDGDHVLVNLQLEDGLKTFAGLKAKAFESADVKNVLADSMKMFESLLRANLTAE